MTTARLIAVLAATTALASAASAQEAMRCSHQLPPAHHIAQVIDRWAAEVETLSNGEIDVQIFGADSLVKANDNILAVAKGDIECAFSLNFQWGPTLPLMNVSLAPYAFQDIETWKAWPDSEAAEFLEEKLAEKGVTNIAWLFQTNSDVFTSNGKPLVKPEDFQGVKIRGLGGPLDDALASIGATPATMPGSEVYQALATGVIDAGLTDVAAAHSRKYYEVQDYMTVTPIISVYLHGYVSQRFFDGLSEAQQAALTDAGRKAADWAIEASVAAAAAAPAELEAQGVTLHVATPEENAALEAALKPAVDAAFAEQTGEDGQHLLALIEKIGSGS
jgi:TRAP-type C4-dicarboxylate transport system substrate-binding protein